MNKKTSEIKMKKIHKDIAGIIKYNLFDLITESYNKDSLDFINGLSDYFEKEELEIRNWEDIELNGKEFNPKEFKKRCGVKE